MRKLFKSDIFKSARPVETFIHTGAYFLLNDNEIIFAGASNNPILDVEKNETQFTHAYIHYCPIDEATELAQRFKPDTKQLRKIVDKKTKPLRIIVETPIGSEPSDNEPQTEDKAPEPKPIQPIQILKNQPLRSYKPRPNPNKSRWDKLNA